MITARKSVVKIKTEGLSGGLEFLLKAETDIKSVALTIKESGTGRCFEYCFQGGGKELREHIKIEAPLAWSLQTPNLYRYSFQATYCDGEQEAGESVFGIRTLATDRKNFYLNGEKIFIRGYIRGARAHDHSNCGRLTEEEFYRKNILQAKKYGFNYIRFHSTVPPRALFKAADELGMLIHIEFRSPVDEYNNLEEMLFAKHDLVSDRFIQTTIDELYDHPSLAVYCIGNELKSVAAPERIVEIGAFIKKTDGSRLFVDTCAWGKPNRANIDFDVQHMGYYFPYGKHAAMYEDLASLHTYSEFLEKQGEGDALNVPLVAHEVCHYTALRDFSALKAKFEKHQTPPPWWIDEELKMIKAKGFEKEYDEMYRASKDFQIKCWKVALEELRRSRLLGGFHFLQFADTDVYENSNGVVDCFDDDTVVTEKEFLRFNGDRVLTAKLKERLLYAGEELSIPVYLSDYAADDFSAANLSYAFKDGDGRTYAEGEQTVTWQGKGVHTLGMVNATLPPSNMAKRLCLELTLSVGERVLCENEYSLWTYPKTETDGYREFCNFEKENALITDDAEKALLALEEGKRVCLVYRSPWTRHLKDKKMKNPKYAFKATWNRFKPVIWDRGTNYGGLCEAALLKKYGFETGRYYDFNYSKITEDCDKIILDDFPAQVRSLVSGTDKNVRDRFDAYSHSFNLPELQYDRTLRRFSYLFEVKVGKGSLLVCGFNLTGLDEREPSSVCMANCIKAYLLSEDFHPNGALALEELRVYLQDCAQFPVKERMMTQFWELDDTPVESREYWLESRAYLTGAKL
ncbi:MAG: hypothetical protein IJX81_03930 [Clostridia bacterium]|nr:hypothetical protein [Clostridia bacterium]